MQQSKATSADGRFCIQQWKGFNSTNNPDLLAPSPKGDALQPIALCAKARLALGSLQIQIKINVDFKVYFDDDLDIILDVDFDDDFQHWLRFFLDAVFDLDFYKDFYEDFDIDSDLDKDFFKFIFDFEENLDLMMIWI